jgi:hypothetical protein
VCSGCKPGSREYLPRAWRNGKAWTRLQPALRRRAAGLLPIEQWDRDDALHVAPSVLLDVDDLKSRPDHASPGRRNNMRLPTNNRQDLDAAASGQDAHGNQDEGRQPCVNLSLTKGPWHFS